MGTRKKIVQVSGVWASLKQNSVEEMMVMATLERFSVKDDREGTDPEMCYMIGSADDRESNNLLGVAAATTMINNPQNEILKNNNKSGTVMDTPSCSKPGCRSVDGWVGGWLPPKRVLSISYWCSSFFSFS
jgi:hypothetical protein